MNSRWLPLLQHAILKSQLTPQLNIWNDYGADVCELQAAAEAASAADDLALALDSKRSECVEVSAAVSRAEARVEALQAKMDCAKDAEKQLVGPLLTHSHHHSPTHSLTHFLTHICTCMY